MLQIARSFVPGGLAGWIIWPKPEPLAALEDTVEAIERIAADGSVVTPLDEDDIRRQAAPAARSGVEALAICLINSYADDDARAADRRDRRRGAARRAGLVSSAVLPEMREYERTITTVANSYVQPQVAALRRQPGGDSWPSSGVEAELSILRSDGGLAAGAGRRRRRSPC